MRTIRYRGAVYQRVAAALPTLTAKVVWHVGTMDPESKGTTSFEGAGLSVSVHPKAWRAIARLGGLDLWRLTNPNGKFLNALKLDKKQKQAIIQWGVENQYVALKTTYRVWSTDEDGEEQYMEFPTREEAEEESYGDDAAIEEVPGATIGTVKLAQRGKNPSVTRDPVGVFDILLTVWVEDTTDLDGVWWKERLDVSSLSAPRGVIIPSKVASWKAEPADWAEAPDRDDDV